MKPSIKYQVIFKHKDKYSINSMCNFFGVSRSGYYAFVKRMNIPDRDIPLAEKTKECQEESHRTYGYRRVHIWLGQGIYRNPKTILRVMQKYNLLSVVRRKKFLTSKLLGAFCIYQSSEICTITVWLHTKWIKNKV